MNVPEAPKWYIVYTSPQKEKKVTEFFSRRKIETYCPVKAVKREYPGRIKRIEYVPLFHSYVFVHTTPGEHPRIRMATDVISLVHWLGKPAVVREEEIGIIKKMLSIYDEVMVEKIPVREDGMISIMHSEYSAKQSGGGPSKNGFVKVQLPSIGFALKARGDSQYSSTIFEEEMIYPQTAVPRFAS